MNIAWGTFTRPDGTSHRQIEISERADGSLFGRIGDLLKTALGGRWTGQIDGLTSAAEPPSR